MIFFKINQFEPIVEFVISEELATIYVFLVFLLLHLFRTVFERVFEYLPFLLCLRRLFLMKIMKFFRMLNDLSQKFPMTCLLPNILTGPHVLLISVAIYCLLLIFDSLPTPIKLPVHQLILIHDIANCLPFVGVVGWLLNI